MKVNNLTRKSYFNPESFSAYTYIFRCLHKSGGVLLFTPNKCAQVIMACLKLHNLCVDLRLPNEEAIQMNIGEIDHHHLPNTAEDQSGQAVRQQLIERFRH